MLRMNCIVDRSSRARRLGFIYIYHTGMFAGNTFACRCSSPRLCTVHGSHSTLKAAFSVDTDREETHTAS